MNDGKMKEKKKKNTFTIRDSLCHFIIYGKDVVYFGFLKGFIVIRLVNTVRRISF